jgi:hypothetical protein
MLIILFVTCFALTCRAFGAETLKPAWLKEGVSGKLIAYGGDGGVIMAFGSRLARFDAAGTTLWDKELPGALTSLEADGSGGVWATWGNEILRISEKGSIEWTFHYDEPIFEAVALPDGRVTATTGLGALLVDEKGKFVWLYDPATGCDT